MKITAPVSSFSDAEMAIHFGADELYCGVTTTEWLEHFGQMWWMNRRNPAQANVDSLEELGNMVALAHNADLPIHLTLNAPFYSESTLDYLVRLAEKLVAQVRVDGLIVSDLNLLLRLAALDLPVRLHLSSVAACINQGAVDLYQQLGISRIILPRQLTLSDIKQLVDSDETGLEFEVFAVNDGCFYEEGFCQTTHTFGPFCLMDWSSAKIETTSQALGPGFGGLNLDHVERYQWHLNNCGSSFQHNGLPNGPCSLCWLGHFRDWGVSAIKIVGREASVQRKVGSLQLVKEVRDLVAANASRAEVASLARGLRDTPQYCDSGMMCYFLEGE